jgi:hypothetical protein
MFVIKDESYLSCWEIEGTQEDILSGLQRLCSSQTGLTFASSAHLNGKFEAQVDVYEQNSYPYKYIGKVRYMWDPIQDDRLNGQRVIRLWTHPSMLDSLQTQLEGVFGDVGGQQPQIKRAKLMESVVFQTPSISIRLIKGGFNRFKLLGPLSTTILSNIINLVDVRLDKTESNLLLDQ